MGSKSYRIRNGKSVSPYRNKFAAYSKNKNISPYLNPFKKAKNMEKNLMEQVYQDEVHKLSFLKNLYNK